MLAEFVEKIVRLARASNVVHEIDDPVKHVVTHVFPDGAPNIEVPYPVQAKHRTYSTLQSFIDAVLESQDYSHCEVLLSPNEIVCVADAYGEVVLKMNTARSVAFQTIATERSYTQHEFAKVVRKFLVGTGMEALLTPLANVQWTRVEGVSGVSTRGKESLGKSVEAAVGNAEAFPAAVPVRLPVFPESSGMAIPVQFLVNIDVRPTEQKFDVWVNPDDLQLATHQTLSAIAGMIKDQIGDDSGVTVSLGEMISGD